MGDDSLFVRSDQRGNFLCRSIRMENDTLSQTQKVAFKQRLYRPELIVSRIELNF